MQLELTGRQERKEQKKKQQRSIPSYIRIQDKFRLQMSPPPVLVDQSSVRCEVLVKLGLSWFGRIITRRVRLWLPRYTTSRQKQKHAQHEVAVGVVPYEWGPRRWDVGAATDRATGGGEVRTVVYPQRSQHGAFTAEWFCDPLCIAAVNFYYTIPPLCSVRVNLKSLFYVLVFNTYEIIVWVSAISRFSLQLAESTNHAMIHR